MSFYDEEPLNLSCKDVKKEPESPPSPCDRDTPPEDYPRFYNPSIYQSPTVNHAQFYRSESVDSWHTSSTPSPSPADFLSDEEEYKEYEKVALAALTQGKGSLIESNPRMRRNVRNNNSANEEYRRQRERNNRAAKESRDRRKLKEVKKSILVAYLEAKLVKERAELEARLCRSCRLK